MHFLSFRPASEQPANSLLTHQRLIKHKLSSKAVIFLGSQPIGMKPDLSVPAGSACGHLYLFMGCLLPVLRVFREEIASRTGAYFFMGYLT